MNPKGMGSVKDPHQFRFKLATALLKASDLEIIFIWSPSYLLSLMKFIEENREQLELELGKEYELVITTFNGLYRYRMGDRVRVVDRYHQAPTFKFMGRAGKFIDLTGEKLSEQFVSEIIHSFQGMKGFFLPCI